MRIPVFARRSNPAISRPILRKSLAYAEEQVRFGSADWVDSLDHAKGIIAREMLPSGKMFVPAETVSVSKAILPPLEPNGCLFVPPPSAQPTDPIVRWMTAVIGKQTSKRLRMEAAALRHEAARIVSSEQVLVAQAV